MDVRSILSNIEQGAWALPEFQRGYVWSRLQVRRLMDSLYREYPVGSLLVWTTRTESASFRGDSQPGFGTVKLLLDGQQRITTLYGLIKGEPPSFFDGNSDSFTDLYFNVEEETFEFYRPTIMKDSPVWISVTEVMRTGGGPVIALQNRMAELDQQGKLTIYLERLTKLQNITNRDFHVEDISRTDLSIDSVVDIFNKVNSGGTHLSKGDLALAKICAQWPSARAEMTGRLQKWEESGYRFTLDWFLRCINTVVTGEALFLYLDQVEIGKFQEGLIKTEAYIDRILNLLSGRLGLDHDRVLGARYSVPLMVKYLDLFDGQLNDQEHLDKLLFWYINVLMWGRYSSGQLESILNTDLEAIEQGDGAIDRLISLLRSNRGDLQVNQADFDGWSKGARFYPMLYMMTRINHSVDLITGVELNQHLLGRNSSLEVHHIFPKSKLYDYGYAKSEVNAIANFTFLTKESNLDISNKDPMDYMSEIEVNHPGALESHWIPVDKELWKIENYLDFLAARRELLASTVNSFLDSLVSGQSNRELVSTSISEGTQISIGGIEDADEEELLFDVNSWVSGLGFKDGEILYELVDNHSDETVAIIDLCWPEGFQTGLTEPVALMINEDALIRETVSSHGFRVFSEETALRQYLDEEVNAEQIELSRF